MSELTNKIDAPAENDQVISLTVANLGKTLICRCKESIKIWDNFNINDCFDTIYDPVNFDTYVTILSKTKIACASQVKIIKI